MATNNNYFKKYGGKLIQDFFLITKVKFWKIFAAIAGLFSTDFLFKISFIQGFIQNAKLPDWLSFTHDELIILGILSILLYILNRFFIHIAYSDRVAPLPEQTDIQNHPTPHRNIYSSRIRKLALKTNKVVLPIYVALLLCLLIRFGSNNDFCSSISGKNMGVKIFQFSHAFETNAKGDGVSALVYNRLSKSIPSDTIEIKYELTTLDISTEREVLNKYLSCYKHGIIAYGFRNPGDSTFICNIYLKNMVNRTNQVTVLDSTIVLDSPEFIAFKESKKGEYIAEFILGLFLYYNNNYKQSLAIFEKLGQDSTSNQLASYSQLYAGYNKLSMHDTSGFQNILKAKRLDISNKFAIEVEDDISTFYKKNKRVTIINDTVEIVKHSKVKHILNSPEAIISLDRTDLIFKGLVNELSIMVNGVDPANLLVTSDKGKIRRKDQHYELVENEVGVDTVRIFEISRGKPIRNIYKRGYRVRIMSDPKVTFGGKSGGSMSLKNAQGQDRLFVDISNLPFTIKSEVVRFTMIILQPRQDVIAMSTTGNRLSPAMISVLQSVRPGSTIVFQNIVANMFDGSQHGLDAIVLTLM